jgi:prepilin-type N-terminal cleavage/methylation domain-containing protein
VSARSETGVTLVELLVSVAILGIIMTALSSALFVGLSASADDHRGIDQSNIEQAFAHYFEADVRAACDPGGSVTCPRNPNPAVSSSTACGSSAPSQFAMDSLSDANGSEADSTVVYALQGGVLQRIECPIGSNSPTSTVNIGSGVTSLTASYPGTGQCAGSFEVVVEVAGSDAGRGTEPYSFLLCARRRAA